MSLSTYAGLKAAIAAWATRGDLAAQIPDFVAWAHQEISRRLRAGVLLTRADVAVSGEFATAPTNFQAGRSLRLDVTPTQRILFTSPEGVEDQIAAFSTAIYPSCVAVEGSQLHFGPLYSTATTGKLLYYATPAALSADGDTNVVMGKYPYLYLFGALEALFRYLEDDNNAGIYGGQFGALISDINSRSMADALSGPLQLAPSPSGIV